MKEKRPLPESLRCTEALHGGQAERSATTSRQWLEKWHDEHSPLGRVRVVCWPAAEDGDHGAVALHDFEPFDN